MYSLFIKCFFRIRVAVIKCTYVHRYIIRISVIKYIVLCDKYSCIHTVIHIVIRTYVRLLQINVVMLLTLTWKKIHIHDSEMTLHL